MKFEHAAPFLLHLCLHSTCIHFSSSSLIIHSAALEMASILQKLFTPLFSGLPEPPRNKVTVVGVGQVGMACAVSILLRVRQTLVSTLIRLTVSLLVSPGGLIPRILLDWHTDDWSLGVWSARYPFTVLVKVWWWMLWSPHGNSFLTKQYYLAVQSMTRWLLVGWPCCSTNPSIILKITWHPSSK